MRRLKRLLTGVCLAALLAAAVMPAAAGAQDTEQTADNTSVEARSANGVTIMSEGNRVPTFEAGKSTTWTLIVHNNSGVDLTNAVLAPSLGEKNEEWPFITDYQSYAQELNIKNGESQAVSFEFTQREDVATSRHTLPPVYMCRETRTHMFPRNSMQIRLRSLKRCRNLRLTMNRSPIRATRSSETAWISLRRTQAALATEALRSAAEAVPVRKALLPCRG